MNKVILTGNLIKDNVLRVTTNQTSVLQNTIAVRRNVKNDKGEYESDFITLVFWGQKAEYINNYAPKGSKIEVVGRWQQRSYQDNQGNTKYVNECVVEECSILNSTKPQEQNAEQPQQVTPVAQVVQSTPTVSNPFNDYSFTDDDLPF